MFSNSGNKVGSSRNSTQASARATKVGHKNAVSLTMTPAKTQLDPRGAQKLGSATQSAIQKRQQVSGSKQVVTSTYSQARANTPDLVSSKRAGGQNNESDPIPSQFFNINSNSSPFNNAKKFQMNQVEEELQGKNPKSLKISEPSQRQEHLKHKSGESQRMEDVKYLQSKVGQLKLENKKLVQLLKDTEKVVNQRIIE